MDRAKSNRPAATFNPRSATYHDELHKEGFISDAQLAAAKSADKTDASKADKEVLDLATFTSQRPLTEKQSEVIGSNFNSSQRERDRNLEARYTKAGYQFKRNKGKDHNCLIISILQHLTGNYASEHNVKAKEYRIKLDSKLKQNLTAAQKAAFPEHQMLMPDDLNLLLPELEKDFKLGDEKKLTVEFWMADAQGEPIKFSIGGGKQKVVIFQRADHFEAVLCPGSAH